MNNNEIGERIKTRRIELNLKQKQIKEKTGISTGNMSEIENGLKLPSTPALIALSEVLECSTDWILKGEALKRENLTCSPETEELLHNFTQLPPDDQEDLLVLAKLKADRVRAKISSD